MNHKTINISNFESYIVDYFDGKLSEGEQQDLFAFLEIHPQQMADFALFKQCKNPVIQPDTFAFPSPEKLKKNVIFPVNDVNESNYQNHFIAFYENDLNESVRQTLFIFLEKNAFLFPEFESFGKLRLVPDKNVVFKEKQRLKYTVFRFSHARWISVASVAAILLLFFLFSPDTSIPSAPVIPEPVFVQTEDNEHVTILPDTINNEPPVEDHIFRKELKPKSTTVPFFAHVEKTTISIEDPDTELSLSEQNTEVESSDFIETVKILEPDVVLIKAISESESATEDISASIPTTQQKKRSLWKIFSWGVKQYNYIANDDVAIVKVENLTASETVYYLCRGE